MSIRKDVLELLRLYEGPNQWDAYKPIKPTIWQDEDEDDRIIVDPKPRDRSDNKWITEDPIAGRWLVFRSQVPDHLQPAYTIAIGEGYLEEHLLKPEQLDSLYRSHGLPGVPQDKPRPIVPNNCDALVLITDKGRAAIAQDNTLAENVSDAYISIGKLWPEHFDTYRKAQGFLADHPEIRTRKPSKNRLEVHAADWIKYWSGQQSEPSDAQIQEYLDGVEQRKLKIRQGD